MILITLTKSQKIGINNQQNSPSWRWGIFAPKMEAYMAKKYKINRTFTYEGKRYYIHADTEAQYGEKKAMLLRDLKEGKIAVNGNMLVKHWAQQCIDTYKTGQKDITRKKYIQRVNHCILEHIGDMRLKDVKPVHCQQVLNRQKGNSKFQINEVHNALNFIFGKAVTNKLIVSNPAQDLVKPQGTKKSWRAITEYEREHIVKVGQTDRRYYLYLLMLYCGCRPPEAASATGNDIKQVDGYNMLHIRGTKTAKTDRLVPIPDELYEIIKNTPKNEFIACRENGNPITDDNRSKLWESFARALNISMGCKMYRNQLLPPFPLADDLVPYCLRHTYCTDLARKGIDIRIAQKLMGHADIKMTANIYTNFDQSDIVAAAKLLQ